MVDLTRAEIEAMSTCVWLYGTAGPAKAQQAITQLLAQLDAANAPPDVARVLPRNIIVRDSVTVNRSICIRDLDADEGDLCGVIICRDDLPALIAALRVIAGEA